MGGHAKFSRGGSWKFFAWGSAQKCNQNSTNARHIKSEEQKKAKKSLKVESRKLVYPFYYALSFHQFILILY